MWKRTKKRLHTEGKYLQSTSKEELVSLIYKELLKFSIKKIGNPIKNGQKTKNTLYQRGIKDSQKYRKASSESLAIREIEMKTTRTSLHIFLEWLNTNKQNPNQQ